MKKLLYLLVFSFYLLPSQAQMLDPAKWTYKVTYPNETEAELLFTAQLEEGWHLYSQRTDPNGPIGISFEFNKSGDYELVGGVREPNPHEEFDKDFNCTVRSFSGKVVFRQKVKRLTEKNFTVTGTFSYQLCNDGSCIAPDDRDFSFKVNGAAGNEADTASATSITSATSDTSTTSATAVVAEEAPEDVTNQPEEKEKKQSLFVIFLLAILGGILTMFTPCVFPMIPMTVNFFVRGADNKAKGRRQAWFFGLSIVFLFAVLGVILALIFGPEALYNMGTNQWVNLVFFVVFFIFALSFFGLFEIKMPEKWINSSDQQADKGGLLAPFFIALTTVLVSFSCTGPILGSALVGLTHTDSAEAANRWVSLVTMLGFGIGFAAPFTLLAMFPQFLRNMKSGSWLNTVKIVFAFLEVAFGLKFLQMADQVANWGLLPRHVYLALWIVVFALLGFYLLGKLRFKGDDEVKEIGTLRLFLAIADLAFVVYMIPGMWGAPLNQISGFLPEMNTQEFNIERIVVENRGGGAENKSTLPANRKYADKLEAPVGFEVFFDLEEAKAYAREVGKPVFIDFTGKSCSNCREMEQYVWTSPEVKRLLQEEYIICSLHSDVNFIDLPEEEWVTDDKGHVLKTLGRKNLYYQKSHFNINAQPYYVIVDTDGTILTKENYKYDRDVQKFVNWLTEGIEGYNARR